MTATVAIVEELGMRERKAAAKEHFKAIVEASVMTSTSSLRIGYHAYWLKKDNAWGLIGFADEDEARKAAGVGESTWYANLRLAEAFEGVEEKHFCAMRQANAKALADLPESKRKSRIWTRLAETASIEDFAGKVDEEMEEKARASSGKERSVRLAMSMPKSRRRVIETKIKEYAKDHDIPAADTGRVIEQMCLETTGGATLIGAITTAVQRVKEAKAVIRSGISADEALGRVEKALDDMVLDFKAALEQAAQKGD